MIDFNTSMQFAENLDSEDKLKDFRKEFFIEDSNLIYLDGNSLGRLPIRTKDYLQRVINDQWGSRLIRSWNEEWYDLSRKCGSKISNIIGAKKDEVIVTDSTSINLYKLVHAAINISKYKTKIITDEFNFPSDHYILQGIISQLAAKYEIKVIKSRDGITIADEDLISEVDDNTALVVLSHSAFKSAYLYDMEKITQAVQKKGALILWDLSHSAGIADVKLNECHVDFAIGCTYKYLNGGPGSPAFMFAREDLHDKLTSPIWGWFGDEHPFNFNLNFKPAKGMNRFFVGTPPIISLAAVDSGIDLVLKAGIGNIRKKSIDQTEYLIYLFNQKLKRLGFSLGSPVSSNRRGSHISIRHPEARRIIQAMTDENNETIVIPDFREPDNIRLGISPLYNTFTEIWKAIEIIENIAVHKIYLNYNPQIRGVT